MATLEQLEEGIRRAHAAGNAEHVKVLGAEYRRMQGAQPAMTAQPNLSGLPAPFGQIAGMAGFNGMPRTPDTSKPEEWDPPGAMIPVQFKKGTGEPRWAVPGILSSMFDAAQLPGEVLSGETPFDPRVSMQDQDPATLDRAATLALNSTGAAVGAPRSALLTKAKVPLPTVKGLFKEAKAGFKAAESSGAVVPQPAVRSFVDDARALLDEDGLISPSGKIADMPKVSHALELADEYAVAAGKLPPGLAPTPMSIKQAMRVRKALGRAARSFDPDERRIGVMLLKQFDDSVEKSAGAAAPLWANARKNYHVASKGMDVEKLISAAGRRHKKSTAVPLESALRNEFDKFVGKDKNLRGFSPAEQAQLSRVANGTVGGNVARGVGNLAPTTLSGLAGKVGIPAGVGALMGAPGVGAAVGVGGVALGYAGRLIAKLSTKHQAELARVLVLNGGKLPKKIPGGLSPETSKAIGNLILMGVSQSPALAEMVGVH